jgi:peptidoglycan hydrolase-like protein with peptidoglycan-binding domain
MRRIVRCFLAANAVLMVTACHPMGGAHIGMISSKMSRSSNPRFDPPAAQAGNTSSRFSTLNLGDRGAQVHEVQRRLNQLGFNAGPPSPEYRPALRVAVWAFQKANGLPPTDHVDLPTWRALSHPARLKPLVHAAEPTRVEIDLRRQLLTAWKDGKPALVTHISTGSGEHYCEKGRCGVAVTPVGDFRAWWRTPGWTKGPLGEQFYTVYFNEEVGFHGSERVPLRPASHGCIRVPLHNARPLYDMIPTGTPVYVRRPERPEQDAGQPNTQQDASQPKAQQDAGQPKAQQDAGQPKAQQDAGQPNTQRS